MSEHQDPGISEATDEETAFMREAFEENAAMVSLFINPATLVGEAGQQNRNVLMANVAEALSKQPEGLQVLQMILDDVQREQSPWIGFCIEQKVLPEMPARVVHHTRVPKSLATLPSMQNMPLGAIIGLATMMGFLLSPALRALLKCYGLELFFEQASSPLKQPSPLETAAPVNMPKPRLV
jgi:hypothetical protein